MRIAELSGRSGVPAATIKFYVREGLLHPGEPTSRNQVAYDETHLRRLRLVRALVDIGGLPVAAARQVVAAIEAPGQSTHRVLGIIHRALLAGEHQQVGDEERSSATGEIDAVAQRRGWQLNAGNPAREAAIEAIAAMRQLGMPRSESLLDQYAQAVEQIAAAEIDLTAARAELGVHGMAERTVIGIVVGGALISALRGMAHDDASTRKFHQ